jgi:hypothetical protein
MTPMQEDHLDAVKAEFVTRVDEKYKKGVNEHGGNLWEYTIEELIDMALDEAIDQFTYLITIKQKLRTKVITDTRE